MESKGCFFVSISKGFDLGKRLRASARALRNVKSIAMIGLLTALQIVLSMTTDIMITTDIRLSLHFLTVAACGMLFGPLAAAAQGAICDVLVAFIAPKGAFFPGFTLSALVGGLIYGLLLYQRPWTWWRLLLAKGLVNLVVNVGLNSLWISMMQGSAMNALIPVRLLKNLLSLPLEAALLIALGVVLRRLLKAMPGLAKNVLPPEA